MPRLSNAQLSKSHQGKYSTLGQRTRGRNKNSDYSPLNTRVLHELVTPEKPTAPGFERQLIFGEESSGLLSVLGVRLNTNNGLTVAFTGESTLPESVISLSDKRVFHHGEHLHITGLVNKKYMGEVGLNGSGIALANPVEINHEKAPAKTRIFIPLSLIPDGVSLETTTELTRIVSDERIILSAVINPDSQV